MPRRAAAILAALLALLGHVTSDGVTFQISAHAQRFTGSTLASAVADSAFLCILRCHRRTDCVSVQRRDSACLLIGTAPSIVPTGPRDRDQRVCTPWRGGNNCNYDYSSGINYDDSFHHILDRGDHRPHQIPEAEAEAEAVTVAVKKMRTEAETVTVTVTVTVMKIKTEAEAEAVAVLPLMSAILATPFKPLSAPR